MAASSWSRMRPHIHTRPSFDSTAEEWAPQWTEATPSAGKRRSSTGLLGGAPPDSSPRSSIHLPKPHTVSPSLRSTWCRPAAMCLIGGRPGTTAPGICALSDGLADRDATIRPPGVPMGAKAPEAADAEVLGSGFGTLPHTTTLPLAVRAVQKVEPAATATAPPFSARRELRGSPTRCAAVVQLLSPPREPLKHAPNVHTSPAAVTAALK
mmetsp:Transcript_38480/g.108762  ORF Transcript_38480/g.108762 Transcript_38480/m.108762 type:complete len:210 (+) Transcript_38480:340-969(+)